MEPIMLMGVGAGFLAGSGCAGLILHRREAKKYKAKLDQQVSAVSAAGHSLRSHLNNILGQSQLLSDRAKSYRSEDKHLISNVLDSSGELRRILLDTLEIIELNTHILRLETKDCILYNALEQMMSTQRLRALRRGVALHADLADSTKRRYAVDTMRLQQCIDSILTQSLYQTRAKNIQIFAAVIKDKKNQHRISIRIVDKSIRLQRHQIDAYFYPRSFHRNRFLNKDSSSRLSLLLSHQLAGQMGGSLRARSLPKGGLEFALKLPLKYLGTLRKNDEILTIETPEEATVEEQGMPPLPSKINVQDVRVLIVDDNTTNLMIIEGLLTMMGYRHITTTTSGAEAIELLSTDHFDAILTDIDMPDMDGLTLAGQIRSSAVSWSDIPMIAVSASTSSTDRELAAAAGMSGFVSKPVLRDELCVVLAEQLGHTPQLKAAEPTA
ncbi:MAG: response regulator [Pseudomonadota bacterium]